MQTVDLPDLRELSGAGQTPCVSIYLPVHRITNRDGEDRIRFKNLLRKARHDLVKYGFTPMRADGLLRPARNLLADRDFWEYQSEGLGVFITNDFFRSCRIPFAVTEECIVSSRFHFGPMIPAFMNNNRYFVLAISQHEARFFEGKQSGLEEVPLKAPRNLDDAVSHVTGHKNEYFHTRTGKGRDEKASSFFSHGAELNDIKQAVTIFCHKLGHEVEKHLKEEKCPLILAGVEYITSCYKRINSYPYLISNRIEGNPERWDPKELLHKAWPLAESYFRRQREIKLAQFDKTEALDKPRTATDIRMITLAAAQGRVETLFVRQNSHVWGEVNEGRNVVDVHNAKLSRDIDLADRSAVQTIMSGGEVYFMRKREMPNGSPVAAVFRY